MIAKTKADVIVIGGIWTNLCPHGYTLDCCNGGCTNANECAAEHLTGTICVLRHSEKTGSKHGGFYRGDFVRWEGNFDALITAGKDPRVAWPFDQ